MKMKLLILTQKVDENDDVLGFFHRWIEEFAKHCERVTVICLYEGEHHLPENVKVLSLGKEATTTPTRSLRRSEATEKVRVGVARSFLEEKISSRLKYLTRFYRYIYRERKNYDAVFVHMNQEYVVLGTPLWRLFRKKILLWRNHKKGSFFTKIAVVLSDRVFYTSEFSYTARFAKSEAMPVGIDTDRFTPARPVERKKGSILSLGRIDPVKNIHILMNALKLIGAGLDVDIYGSGEGSYYANIKKECELINKQGGNKVSLRGSVPNSETPGIYNQHEIFVNLTVSGSMDKTILEAMACGTLPLVCNRSFVGVLPEEFLFRENNADDLAKKIERVINLPNHEKKDLAAKLRDIVVRDHNVQRLVWKIIKSVTV